MSKKTHPFKALISYSNAREAILAASLPVAETEPVPIEDGKDRVLAENIVAPIDVPSFDRAAMDGFALKAEETYGASQFSPKKFRLKGAVFAGEVWSKKIEKGECLKIATGAMIPEGTDSVVMIEDTEYVPNRKIVNVYRPVYPGANISVCGSDIKKGETILHQNERITVSRVGVLAALGIKNVRCYRKPVVTIIPTGDEIAEPGESLHPSQIYNSNSYVLASLVTENGGIARREKIVSDTFASISSAVKKGLRESDLVVVSGGSSVGERDILVDVLSQLGKVLFHGVQIKPGKPTVCGVVGRGSEGYKLVLGLPGYPTASMVAGILFLVPAIRRLAHLPEKSQNVVRARLGQKFATTVGRRQFIPVKLKNGFATPVYKESGAITSMANADGYIEIPENVDLIEKGDEVEVIML